MMDGAGPIPGEPDVLVVGGGAAGMLAAVAAKKRGASVVVVKKHGGATAMSSGAVDVAETGREESPGPASDPFHGGAAIQIAMERVAGRHPLHPYARLGAGGRERMPDALALLVETAAGADLVGRSDGQNLVVATQLGTTKRTALVQRAQHIDLSVLDEDARVVVVEFEDLAGFDAAPVAAMLQWIDALVFKGLSFGTLRVPRVLPTGKVHASPYEMATRLDDPLARAKLFEALDDALQAVDEKPTHLLLPPVLSRAHAAAALLEARDAASAHVAELLALPSSAPGERLSAALAAGAAKQGVVVVDGIAKDAVVSDQRVVSVVVDVGGASRTVSPRAVVLASGRYLAGGLVRDQQTREPLFGLPVFAEGRPFSDHFIGAFLADHPAGEHLAFRAGVAVDETLRPKDARGHVFAKNLFAAGSILEGYDPARDGTGLGVAALTGLVAGEHAAALLFGAALRATKEPARV